MTATFWRIFAASAVITLRSLPTLGSVRVAVIRVAAAPIATGLFYLAVASSAGAITPGPDAAIAAGAAVGVTSASMATSSILTLDRLEGTLTSLILAASGRFATWAGRLSVLVGLGLVTAGLVTLVTLAIAPGRGPTTEWIFFAPVVVVAGAAGTSIGLFLSAIGLGMRDSLLIANIAEFALPLLCGAVAPVTVLPAPIQWIAQAIPVTSAITAGRSAANGDDPTTVWIRLGIAVAVSLVWLAAAAIAWAVSEHRARVSGTLDLTPV